MEILVIFILLFFGISCSSLAYRYNRNNINWFFIGALFGIFALILLLCIGENKTSIITYNNEIPKYKFCEFCGELILKTAIKCKHCKEMVNMGKEKEKDNEREKELQKKKEIRKLEEDLMQKRIKENELIWKMHKNVIINFLDFVFSKFPAKMIYKVIKLWNKFLILLEIKKL